MCMGAILNARLDSVYFGAYDAKAGACGSVIDLNAYPFNHTCAVSGGHMEDESAKLLRGISSSGFGNGQNRQDYGG